MLKQLWELKQGQRDIEDFITDFKNLKLLSKIPDDHTLEILQSNVSWDAMKQFVTLYGPPTNYEGLKFNLTDINKANAYPKAIYYSGFNQQFHPHAPTP